MLTASHACFSCVRAWHAVVKVPIHKFHAYHVTRRHQGVCRCSWYVWKSWLEDFFFVGFVSQIFVVAIMDISPVTQNFHCTFNAFYFAIYSSSVFPGSHCWSCASWKWTLVSWRDALWNMRYAHFQPSLLYTDIFSSSEISCLVLLHVATLQTN